MRQGLPRRTRTAVRPQLELLDVRLLDADRRTDPHVAQLAGADELVNRAFGNFQVDRCLLDGHKMRPEEGLGVMVVWTRCKCQYCAEAPEIPNTTSGGGGSDRHGNEERGR